MGKEAAKKMNRHTPFLTIKMTHFAIFDERRHISTPTLFLKHLFADVQ